MSSNEPSARTLFREAGRAYRERHQACVACGESQCVFYSVWEGSEEYRCFHCGFCVASLRQAGYVVGRLRLDAQSGPVIHGVLAGSVMSLGAGFYEELVFRVGLFGLGLPLVRSLFQAKQGTRRIVSWIAWAAVTAALFSGWHYVGEFGDPFELRSFTFRWVCGLVFTVIYAFRGFAPAVWTHTLYDLWVIVL